MGHPKGGTSMNAFGFDFVLDRHPEAMAFHAGSHFAAGGAARTLPGSRVFADTQLLPQKSFTANRDSLSCSTDLI
jgi:hypothetical protein